MSVLDRAGRTVLGWLGLKGTARRLFLWFASEERRVTVRGTTARFVRQDFGDHIELNQVHNEVEVVGRLRDEVRPDDVFLDVGSNLGVYAVFVGERLREGHVIAVEPVRATAEKLARNLELNGVEATVGNVAFGDSPGTVYLAVPESHGNAAVVPDGTGVSASVVRGDRFLDEKGLPGPTVVKVDVEGYELAVLRGLESTLRQPACRLLYCEVHPDRLSRFGGSVEEVRAAMEGAGFAVEPVGTLPGERFVLRGAKA